MMLLLLVGPIRAQDGADDCPSPPIFEAEAFGRVTPGDANNVRDVPSRDGELVGQIPGGGLFQVTGEAACDDRFTWVPVEAGDLVGWTVQGTATDTFVEPVVGEVFSDDVLQIVFPEDFAGDVITERREPSNSQSGSLPQFLIYDVFAPSDGDDAPEQVMYLYILAVEEVTDEMWVPTQALERLKPILSGEWDISDPIFEITPPNEPTRNREFVTFPIGAGSVRILVARQHEVPMAAGRGV
ncbi:MAG: SH3 domain-containing protein, partial [Chloroflexota bacterium]